MNESNPPIKVAVLDDYQNVALELADWSQVQQRTRLDVFNHHLADAEAVVERLHSYGIVCVMRERTPLRRNILERLPNLKLICSTGRDRVEPEPDGAGRCRGGCAAGIQGRR